MDDCTEITPFHNNKRINVVQIAEHRQSLKKKIQFQWANRKQMAQFSCRLVMSPFCKGPNIPHGPESEDNGFEIRKYFNVNRDSEQE